MTIGMRGIKFIGIDEWHIETEQKVLSTTLGSCVSVCLWAPHHRTAGMNHFLLPNQEPGHPAEFGSTLTDQMVQRFIVKGILPDSISAIVTGGGSSAYDHYNIGEKNAAAAIYTLQAYGINKIQTSVGGPYSRKLTFHVNTGVIEVSKIHLSSGRVLSKECLRF